MIQQPPNWFERLQYTLSFWRKGYRRYGRTVQPAGAKKVPFIWPDWRKNKPEWQLINYEGYVREGFASNAVIYSAIMYKYRACMSAPMRAYTGTLEEPELLPIEHPLQALCHQPNKWMSWEEFHGLAEVYINISGNCYVYVERLPGQETPAGLYLLRPDRVSIVPTPDRKSLIGFLYMPEQRGEGVPYLAKDIIHIKFPNPGDTLDGLGYGLSPLSPAAWSADVDNDVTKFLKLFFEKGAMLPGLLSYDVPLTAEQVGEIKERWQEIYGSYENWVDTGILDQGGKYQRLGLTFQELDMSALDARNESRIASALGVPLTLIESRPQVVQSTYSNKETDRAMFWQDTMVPELRLFEREYQYYLQGDAGEFVMFDFSEVPALSMTQQERLATMQNAYTSGAIDRNEFRSVLGFDPVEDEEFEPEPKPTEDDTLPEAEDEAEEEENNKRGQGASQKKVVLTPEQKDAFWYEFDRKATEAEDGVGEAVNEAFEEDRRRVLAILNDNQIKARQDKASLDWTKVLNTVTNYFTGGGAVKNWIDKLAAPLASVATGTVERLDDTFKQSTPPDQILAQDWFNNYVLQFAQPINATSEEVLRALLQQASAEGWSINTTTKRIDQMFRQWMKGDLSPEDFDWIDQRLPFYRREAIARTEIIRANNATSNALYREWGIRKKEWLATRDNRVRDDHRAANGQVVGINEQFTVGGEKLRYPGDPMGSPGNTINCRCTEIPAGFEE
jgi:HK97 family phage portal protein